MVEEQARIDDNEDDGDLEMENEIYIHDDDSDDGEVIDDKTQMWIINTAIKYFLIIQNYLNPRSHV